MFDMAASYPIEIVSSEQVRYWEDSRFTEASQELDSSMNDSLNLELFRILSTLDDHFVPIYEKSLDLADWLESLTERLLNEENPDPELVNELRNFVVSLVKMGAIHQNPSEIELLNQETADLFVEDEESFSFDEFMYAPNNSYNVEWRFPNWNDDFTVQYVLCKGSKAFPSRQALRNVHNSIVKQGNTLLNQQNQAQQTQPQPSPAPVSQSVQEQKPKHKHHRSKSVLKKTWHFIKKHRKTIIIVAVAVTAVAITAGLASGGATAALATTAAAANSSLNEDRRRTSPTSNENGKTETPSSPPQPPSKEGSFVQQQSPVLATSKLKDEFLNQKPLSPEKELAKDRRPDFDIGREIKGAAATLVHELWQPAGAFHDSPLTKKLREDARQVFGVMKEVANKVLPFTASTKAEFNSDDVLSERHQKIDEFFGISRESPYEKFVETREKNTTKGELPLLVGITSTASKVGNTVNRVIKVEQKAASLVERMAAEVNGGALEGRVGTAAERAMVGKSANALERGVVAEGRATVAEGTLVKEAYVIREIIVPGGQIFEREILSKAGQVIDREGLTKAGRALDKHGNRPGSHFPKGTGTPLDRNLQGQRHLDEILNHPDKKVLNHAKDGFEIYIPDGRGAHFKSDGSLVGFVEERLRK